MCWFSSVIIGCCIYIVPISHNMAGVIVQVGETVVVKWKKFYDAVVLTIGLYIFVVDVHDFILTFTGSEQEVTNAEEEMVNFMKR